MILKILCLLAITPIFASQSAVTYDFSGGRFGDCLLTYLHAKWLSYQYQIPLHYKPFKYSSDLCLDEKEIRYGTTPGYITAELGKRGVNEPNPEKRLLYICPYFSEDPVDAMQHPSQYRFAIDKKDKNFQKIARAMIAPKRPLSLTEPPKHTINIAIHIREGGGYDTDHTRTYDPLKLPPHEFYIEGLLKILDHFKDKPIYCYLFTDALQPETLARKFQEAIPFGTPITLDYRKTNNHHAANVLEDFFSLFNFDILIRPFSNYSVVASMIHDYAMVYSPTNSQRVGTKITITQTNLEIDQELYQELLK